MIDVRYVDHYAVAGGVERSVAERDIMLTYFLKMMKEHGIIEKVAFKGGTCIRKMYLGRIGRFSQDLDFTLIGHDFDDFSRSFYTFIEKKNSYGFSFDLKKIRGGWGRSYACEVEYSHEWNNDTFKFEVSLREDPTLELEEREVMSEMYFRYLE